jgi:hypothetical protein
MLIVPVRLVGKKDGGVLCRLGSEPPVDAAVEFLPTECVERIVQSEESDLAVVVLNPNMVPDSIKGRLGLG